MSTLDPEGLVTFDAAGQRYTAFFGFRAMKAVELHYDLPFFQALQQAMPSLSPEDAADPRKVAEAGARMRVTEVGRLLEFVLLKHHPEIDEVAVETIADAVGLTRCAEIVGAALAAALASGDGEEEAGTETARANPPRRGRKTG